MLKELGAQYRIGLAFSKLREGAQPTYKAPLLGAALASLSPVRTMFGGFCQKINSIFAHKDGRKYLIDMTVRGTWGPERPHLVTMSACCNWRVFFTATDSLCGTPVTEMPQHVALFPRCLGTFSPACVPDKKTPFATLHVIIFATTGLKFEFTKQGSLAQVTEPVFIDFLCCQDFWMYKMHCSCNNFSTVAVQCKCYIILQSFICISFIILI